MGHSNLGWKSFEVFSLSRARSRSGGIRLTFEFSISTERKIQAFNITATCQSLVGETRSGIAFFNIMHTTAALLICEDEPDLKDDIVRVAEHWLSDLRPFQHGRYGAPNAEAHLTSAFAGTALTIPIVAGKLLLGAWQCILLLELDGPRRRNVVCTIIESQD